MHWKSTLLLILLTAGAGLWLWKGDEWAVKWGLHPAPEPAASSSESVAFLATTVTPEAITRIEIPASDATETVVLSRTDVGSDWQMPGNWPLRKPAVDELVTGLTNLRTRFSPIAITPSQDLKPFGLTDDQKPVTVTLTTAGQVHRLAFGEAPLTEGASPFTRPTYLRIDERPEVLRLGPDVMPILRRSLEEYRKRQIFSDVQRVRLDSNQPAGPMGAPPPAPKVEPILADAIQTVDVIGPDTEITIFGVPFTVPDGRFTLHRSQPTPKPEPRSATDRFPALSGAKLASAWETSYPARDQVDPERLKSLLTSLPELWAEGSDQRPTLLLGLAAAMGSVSLSPAESEAWILARTGLANPERRILLTRAGKDARPLELRIGSVAYVKTVNETGREEYRYAMLEGNPFLFVVKSDRLGDVFAKAPAMRDTRLARFGTEDVEDVTVVAGGQTTQLTRKRGNSKAATDAEKKDRWYLERANGSLLADEAKVSELLTLLAGLESPANRQSFTDAAPSHAKVTIRTRETRPDDLPPGPERTFTFLLQPEPIVSLFGIPVMPPGSVRVALEGWPRVNRIDNPDNRVTNLVDRPAVAYRSRKLFDTAVARLQSVAVQGASGDGFSLARSGEGWELTKPPVGQTDAAKSNALSDKLSQVEAVEFVADAPKPEELSRFGLDKSPLTVTLTFKGDGAPKEQKLEIGGPRDGKPEAYARLDGGTVFTIPDPLVASLQEGALSLLPTQIFNVDVKNIQRLDVARGENESYSLAPKDKADWQITGPFTAPVPTATVTPMLTTLSTLTAQKYQALAAADSKAFGLETPALTLGLRFLEPTPGAKEQTRTLLIGRPAEDGKSRYAQVEGGTNSAVFLVSPEVLTQFDRPALDLLDTNLLKLDPSTITKIEINGPGPDDSLALANASNVWTAPGQDFQVDRASMAEFLRRLINFDVYRIVGYGDKVNWAEHGLQPAERTVTVTVGGKQPGTHTIAIGKKDMTGDRYVRIDNGPALALLLAGDAADLNPGRLHFVDRTLLRFSPAEFNGLVRAKGKDELEIEPGTTQGWTISKPTKQKADLELMEGGEGLIPALSQLRSRRVAALATREDLKTFGLDTPAATLTLKIGDKPEEKVLRVGSPVEASKPEGDRYAFVEGPGPKFTVGVLPGAITKTLLADPIYFRDRSLARFLDADRLVLERGDRKITFAKIMGTWRVLEPVRAEAEHNDLEDLFNAFANLRADELVQDKADDLASFGLDRPQAKWKAFNRGKEELSLLIGKTQDGRAYAKLEKPDTIVFLGSGLTKKVLDEYRKRKVWDDVDAAQAVSVVISAADRTFQFAKFGPAWDDPTSPKDRISTPAMNDFLGALAGLSATRFVADTDADMKLYGLDKPQRVIVLTQRSPEGVTLTRSLRIGAAEGGSEGKRVYAAIDQPGRTDVFVLNEADTARLMKDRAEFLEKK